MRMYKMQVVPKFVQRMMRSAKIYGICKKLNHILSYYGIWLRPRWFGALAPTFEDLTTFPLYINTDSHANYSSTMAAMGVSMRFHKRRLYSSCL